MKYLQAKANKTVKLLLEWELARVILKFITKNLLLPESIRQYAIVTYSFLPLQSSVVSHKFRCRLSGQSNSIISYFKLNRMQFKVLASSGLLAGIKKNSW